MNGTVSAESLIIIFNEKTTYSEHRAKLYRNKMGDGLVSKVHRLFLQAVANNGSLSVTLALEILKAIHGKCK